MKESEIINSIEHSLRNYDLGDIKALRDANKGIAGFILCACFIEHVCTFCYGNDVGNKEFTRFIDEYVNVVSAKKYESDRLRVDLRNKLVHNYSLGERYALTNRAPSKWHLEENPNQKNQLILNLEDFISDLEAAFDKYMMDLRNNKNELRNNALRAFSKTSIIGHQINL